MRWFAVAVGAVGAVLAVIGAALLVQPEGSHVVGGEREVAGDVCEWQGYRDAVIVTDTGFAFHGPRPGEPEGCVGRFILAGFPRDGVAAAFQPYGPRIGVGVPDCPESPLSIADLTPGHVLGGPVRVRFHSVCAGEHRDGPAYVARVWIGRDAPEASLSELDDVLASFRFLRPPEPS